MYKNILVPTDLANKSELSVQTALTMASQNHGSVQGLHVVEKMGGEPDAEVENFYLKLTKRADQKLSDWQRKFQEEFADITIDKTMLVGKRAQEMLQFLQKKAIDLIVITSRAFNKVERGLGTLSHQISLFSPISVLVVR